MDEDKAKQAQAGFLGNTGMEYFHKRLQEVHNAAPDEETRKRIRQEALQKHIDMQNSLTNNKQVL